MSLVTYTSPLSAVNPKVWWKNQALHARTPLLLQILCLFLWRQEVIADPRRQLLIIERRIAWFFPSKRMIRFKDISHLDYSYDSLATSWNFFGETTDAVESFKVGLVLEDREEISLMSFRGGGSAQTGMRGVFLGDSVVDVRGNQEEKSRRYIDHLQEVTGKGLSKQRTFFKRDDSGRPSRTKYE